jgi:hypothetical protein
MARDALRWLHNRQLALAQFRRAGLAVRRPWRTRTSEERKVNGKRPREKADGAKMAGNCEVLGLDRVGSVSIPALGGGDGQSEFLAYRAG